MDASLMQAIAEELDVDVASLTSDALLADIERWDSITALSIMVLLGDALGHPVSPGAMVTLKVFGDIESLITASVRA